MTTASFLDLLGARPLLCDGGMGTQLMARGLPAGHCGELWNLERPDAVQAIHAAYRAAGCRLLTTNTFGASSANLERHGLAGHTRAVNVAGARLARQAAGSPATGGAWVLGDIGPFGGFLEPLGDMTADRLLAIFTDQAAALREGGADGIIIETMVAVEELTLAVRAAKRVTAWPVIATFAFNKATSGDGFVTIMGTTPADGLGAAIGAGADAVGANCGTSLDLEDYVRLTQACVAAAGPTPVLIQPNAGAPQVVDGVQVHPATPADMAALAPRLRTAGARIIGGCCGTTPDHLRQMGVALAGA